MWLDGNNADHYLDGARMRSIMCYAQHSEHPNAVAEFDNRRFYLRALRHIYQGEQITIAYEDDGNFLTMETNGFTFYTRTGF